MEDETNQEFLKRKEKEEQAEPLTLIQGLGILVAIFLITTLLFGYGYYNESNKEQVSCTGLLKPEECNEHIQNVVNELAGKYQVVLDKALRFDYNDDLNLTDNLQEFQKEFEVNG